MRPCLGSASSGYTMAVPTTKYTDGSFPRRHDTMLRAYSLGRNWWAWRTDGEGINSWNKCLHHNYIDFLLFNCSYRQNRATSCYWLQHNWKLPVNKHQYWLFGPCFPSFEAKTSQITCAKHDATPTSPKRPQTVKVLPHQHARQNLCPLLITNEAWNTSKEIGHMSSWHQRWP